MSITLLKIIAVLSMTIDHTLKILPAQSILMNQFGMSMQNSSVLLRVVEPLGKIAFPIFAFCVAEGCIHTSNKRRYLLRLLVFAVLSELPYRLAFHHGILSIGAYNVIFTMLIGAAACFCYEYFRSKNKQIIGILLTAVFAFLAEMLHTDYGAYGVLLIAAPYMFTEKKLKIASIAVLVTGLYLLKASYNGSTLMWLNGNMSYIVTWLCALASVVLLCFYNGQRGRKIKFSFYVYYPLHMMALCLVQVLFFPNYSLFFL